MSLKTLARYVLPVILLLAWFNTYADDPKDPNKKSTLDKVAGALDSGTEFINKTAQGLAPYLDIFGGNGNALRALTGANIGPQVADQQFPMCSFAPTSPQVGMCIDAPTSMTNESGNNMAVETNLKTISTLLAMKNYYASGASEFSNEGFSNQGVSCLRSQLDQIELTMNKMNKSFDDSINAMKIAARELQEQIAAQKESLDSDYNLLFTGKNDRFNLENDLLGRPGCSAMLEKSSLKKSYENGGLVKGVSKDETTMSRMKDSTEFITNNETIYQELQADLNSLSQKIQSQSISDLVKDGAAKGILDDIPENSQNYILKDNNGFSSGLIKSISSLKKERDVMINKIKPYLGNDKHDNDFLASLSGDDSVNKFEAFQNWQNGKKLNCIYNSFKINDKDKGLDALVQKIFSRASSKNELRLRDFTCAGNPSCKAYVIDSLRAFTSLNDGSNNQASIDYSSLESRLNKLESNKDFSATSAWTFKSTTGSGENVSLPALLKTITTTCTKSTRVKGGKYLTDFVATINNTKVLDKLQTFDNNFKKNIIAKMRNEVIECKGKDVSYKSCSAMLPTSSNSFCFRQAALCSQGVDQCQRYLNGLIDTTKGKIKINVDNINAKVNTFKSMAYNNAKTQIQGFSSFIQGTLATLGPWAGYSSPEYNFERMEDKYIQGKYDELQKPPMDVKLLDAKAIQEEFVENIKKMKEANTAMFEKIQSKMKEKIRGVKENYSNALNTIERELQRCMQVNKDQIDRLSKLQKEQCSEEEIEDKATDMIDDILDDIKIKSSLDLCFIPIDKSSNLDQLRSEFKHCNNINTKINDVEGICTTVDTESRKNMEILKIKLKDQLSPLSGLFDKIQENMKNCKTKEEKTKCNQVYTSSSGKTQAEIKAAADEAAKKKSETKSK